MAKHRNDSRAAAFETSLTVREAGGRRPSKVTFGNVTINGSTPDPDVVKGNVERGLQALERALARLRKPGVTIRPKRGVPLYSAVDGEPGVFLRKLDGRIERGRLIDGAFQIIDCQVID